MKRLPAMLTMIDPGELRSDNANQGAPTRGTVGPHQASSITSSAAPSFSAARIPSPVLATAPTVHSVVIGARWYLTRICSLCSNPPLPRITPRRARMSCGSAVSGPWVSRTRMPATTPSSMYRSVIAVFSSTGTPASRNPMRSGAMRARPIPTRFLPVAWAHIVRAPTLRLRNTPRGWRLSWLSRT